MQTKTHMQDRRTALAIFISIMVIVFYSEIVLSPEKQPLPAPTSGTTVAQPQTPPAQQANQQSPAIQAPPIQGQPGATAEQASAYTLPTASVVLASPQTTIITDTVEVSLSSLGGRATSYKLRGYKASLESDELYEKINREGVEFPLGVYVSGISDANVQYAVVGSTSDIPGDDGRYTVPAGKTLSLKLQGTLSNGTLITKTFRFTSGRYIFDIDVALGNPSSDGSPVWLEWLQELPKGTESNRYNLIQYSVFEADEDLTHLTPNDIDERFKEYQSSWISFGDNYFMASLIPTQGGTNVRAAETSEGLFRMQALGTANGGEFKLYIGPKDQALLKEAGYKLYRNVDLGWFAFIGQPILRGLEFLHGILGNYGLAIVLLTLLLKAALLPLTRTSYKSMKAMQDLQPEIAALRERIKDATQLNQEMMALYKRKGVNPMGGCLPIVIQIPIFLGMYNALLVSIKLRHAPFALWINDLSSPERLELFHIHVPVMIIIMGLSMLLQQLTTPSGMDPQQKKIMLLMPIMFTVMFVIFPFPSGLVLYWLVNNLVSIAQQVALRGDRGLNPWYVTAAAGTVIFGTAFILTLLPAW